MDSIQIGEHGAAVAALPWLPIAVFSFLAGVHAAAMRGVVAAQRFEKAYTGMSGPWKLALLLMAASATVHLALVPSHSQEPVTAALFVLDGLAYLFLCLRAFTAPGWRPLAVSLLAANLATYLFYLAAHLEVADAVGVGTKAIELGAIVLLLIRPGSRLVSTVKQSVQLSANHQALAP